MWFYSFASPILLYLFIFLLFSHSSAPSVSEPSVLYNQQHRLLLMNGKINAMHFVIISFAVSRCLSPCLIFPPHYASPHSHLYLYLSLRVLCNLCSPPLGNLLSPSSCIPRAFMNLPPRCQPILPIFQSFQTPPPPPLSTLMRSRMTMNTPIIMRKQQTFPLPLRTPLPNLGPPINR